MILMSTSILSTDTVEKTPSFKFIGKTTPSLSLASITVFPMDIESWDNRCFDMHKPNFHNFSMSEKSRVLLWIIKPR